MCPLRLPPQCGGTTHVLRLSWSPDGQYLVSAHAMNNSGPTAQIIERDGWKTNMDFVGHRKAVTVVVSNQRRCFFVIPCSSLCSQLCFPEASPTLRTVFHLTWSKYSFSFSRQRPDRFENPLIGALQMSTFKQRNIVPRYKLMLQFFVCLSAKPPCLCKAELASAVSFTEI